MYKKIWVGIGILIFAGIIFFMFKGGSTTGQVSDLIDEEDIVKIPLSDVSRKAVWYNYNSDGVNIRFFVIEAKDGSVKTAFDACDVCYKSRKGYRQEGDDMVCNNCENHYPISGIGTANLRGGCWPGYLPSKLDGEYVIIRKADLEKGAYRFV